MIPSVNSAYILSFGSIVIFCPHLESLNARMISLVTTFPFLEIILVSLVPFQNFGSLSRSITYEDFKKLDLRVAKIIKTEKISGKSRIIKGQIDLGKETQDVVIGGAEFYEPDDLMGKTVIVVANLETKNIAGIESNAMLLAADLVNKPFWLTVDEEVPPGTKIK